MDILTETLYITLIVMCCRAVTVIQLPRVRRLTHQPTDDAPSTDQVELKRIAEVEHFYGPRAVRACVSLEYLMAAYEQTD